MLFRGNLIWPQKMARASALALGCSIPVSVAVDNVLLVLVFVGWLASLDRAQLSQAWRHPLTPPALLLIVLLALGLLYGSRYTGDGWRYLGKYADLLFIPVFATLFASVCHRRLAFLAYALTMAVILVLSCLMWAGWLPASDVFVAGQRDASVFKKSLTHNLLMAFAVFVFVYLGRTTSHRQSRWAWFLLAALGCINVMFMNEGKTGQIVLLALAIHLAFSSLKRGIAIAVATTTVVATLVLVLTTDNPLQRAIADGIAWIPGVTAATSTGERIEYYRNTLEIVRANPVFGTGTGSFPRIYAEFAKNHGLAPTDNPHSEYLNIMVQLGLIGVLALGYLLLCAWRSAGGLPPASRALARGLVLAFAIGCLFNSLLMDHVEGLLFAWASGVLYSGAGQQGAAVTEPT